MTWPEFADRCIDFRGRSLDDIRELINEFTDDPETSMEDCERMMDAMVLVKTRMEKRQKHVD